MYHPEVVERLHRDFVHAGSDVVVALTFYQNREKLAAMHIEHLLERINQDAFKIARKVAEETGSYLAASISSSNSYVPEDHSTHELARKMFQEQVKWAKEAGVDFIIAESISNVGEALIVLEEIKKTGTIAVVTLTPSGDDKTWDSVNIIEACVTIERAGADVVGLNDSRGPKTMLPLLKQLSERIRIPIAILPAAYRTTAAQPTMTTLKDNNNKQHQQDRAFPVHLDPFVCTRTDIAQFTDAAKQLKSVKYFGLCSGSSPHHIRAISETLGRKPPASQYSADMTRHFIHGSGPGISPDNQNNISLLTGKHQIENK